MRKPFIRLLEGMVTCLCDNVPIRNG